MAQLFYEPLARVFTNTGAVGAGYKYYFYTTGTTTPISSYTTQALSTPNAYPVVADSNGRFPPIWLSNLNTTKVILADSNDVVIETQDPIGATSSTTSLNDLDVRPTSYWGLTAGTSTAYTLTANPSISAYSNVQTFFFQPHIANGAAATIAVSGLSALNLKKYTGQGTKVALQVGDLQASERYEAICDGVDIVILNPRNKNTYYGTTQALTIATGVIAITNGGSIYTIDTEGATATDNLDTINGGGIGEVIVIQSANSSRDIVVTNSGNIITGTGQNITLETVNDQMVLKYDGASWIKIAFNRTVVPFYDSGEQAITSSGTLSLSHGLGKIPDIVKYYIICKTTQFNWAVGDTIEVYPHIITNANAENIGFESYLTTSVVNIYYGSSAFVFQVLDKTTRDSNAKQITPANWKLVIRAYLLT